MGSEPGSDEERDGQEHAGYHRDVRQVEDDRHERQVQVVDHGAQPEVIQQISQVPPQLEPHSRRAPR
jgi:hypothetical protein